MKTKRNASLLVAASLTVISGYAQTAAEQMQKGIYTQETAGDTDGAIAIYRQIVNSGNSPRDLAAQAQYRLAQTLLQKGDLSNAAQEFEKLARSYADYGKLISSMASTAQGRTFFVPGGFSTFAGRGGRGGGPSPDASLTPEQRQELDRAKLDSAMKDLARLAVLQRAGAISFDSLSPVTVKGTVFKVEWVNPVARISVDSQDGTRQSYTFATASPNQLVQQGATRESVKQGDEVTITGLLANGVQTMPDGTIAASATTVTRADGLKVFDRSAIQK